MKKMGVWVISVVFLAFVSIVAYCSVYTSAAVTVELTQLALEDLQSRIDTNGLVEASRSYEIRVLMGGLCEALLVSEGDRVKAGQPLFRVSDPSIQSQLSAARAESVAAEVDLRNTRRGASPEELNAAEAEISRLRLEISQAQETHRTNEMLLEKRAISRQEAEESQRAVRRLDQALRTAGGHLEDLRRRFDATDLERAKSRLTAAAARLRFLEHENDRLTVRSPIDGTLYHFNVKHGAYVNPGDLVGHVADLQHLRVRAFVDEPELARVAVGREVVVRWDGRPADSWKGSVLSLPAQVVARGSRSVGEVLCSIDTPDENLLPNVNVDVEIITAQGPKVSTLPRSCVFPSGGDHYVWVVADGRAARRSVQVGRSNPRKVEITSGLAATDTVIVPGEFPLEEGLKVRVAEK